MRQQKHHCSQAGFTIVEFMIAGTLGLILLAGTLQIFMGSRQSIVLQNAMTEVQDSGRMALHFLADDLQRAGWNNNLSGALPVHIRLGAGQTQNACRANASGGPSADCLEVRYGGTQDCLGNTVVGTTVTNRYYVQYRDADDDDDLVVGDLMCLGNGNATPQALVGNVENFQLMYGLDLEGDKVANRYVDASALTSVNIGQVVSMRLALVVASDANTLDAARAYTAAELTLLNEAGYTRSDRRMRRVYNLTVPLLNR